LSSGTHADVLLVGLGRYGAALAANLRDQGCSLLAVDFDPTNVEQHARNGYRVHYGDAEDPEFVATLPLAQMRWVVSTVRDRAVNRLFVQSLRQQGYRGRIAVAASNQRDATILEQEGVDLVLIPYSDAAREAANRLVATAFDAPKPIGEQ
ncbi:MAG TPA: NAD-binding protein, partial [Gammaproteobacteria bacterium]|nr:NAD-binding protein [Gammaproteobacteria bacterium]